MFGLGILLLILAIMKNILMNTPKKVKKLHDEFERWLAKDSLTDMRIGIVKSINQHARTGTKAYVEWHANGCKEAVWAKNIRLSRGQIIAVNGFYGHGHHHSEEVYFIASCKQLPKRLIRAWKKHKNMVA